MDVQIGGVRNQPLCQGWFAEKASPCDGAAADDDFGNAGKPGKLRDLVGHIIPIGGLNGGSQLLGQVNILPEAVPVRLTHGGEIGGFHKQSGKAPAEGPCHSRRGTDNFPVGWGRGQADQDMLVRVIVALALEPGAFGEKIHPVRTPTQCKLP